MDNDLKRLVKCIAVAFFVPVVLLWLFLASLEGFMSASIKVLIALTVVALLVLWIVFCVCLFDK